MQSTREPEARGGEHPRADRPARAYGRRIDCEARASAPPVVGGRGGAFRDPAEWERARRRDAAR